MCAFKEALDSDYSKKREYLKQQHQLRTMSKVNHAISADDMIENLLSNKEIFQKKKDPNPSKSSQFQQPVLPAWLSPLQEPLLYRQVWTSVTTPSGFADTTKLSNLLLSSRLSTETLGYIWSLANATSAPALSQCETYVALALVALAQNGYSYTSANVLYRLKEAPLPKLTLYEDKPQPPPPPAAPLQSAVPDYSLGKSAGDDFSLGQSAVDDFSLGKSTVGSFNVKQSAMDLSLIESTVDPFSLLDMQETSSPSLSLIDCSPSKTFTQETKTQPVKEPDVILAVGDDSFGDFQSVVLPSTSAPTLSPSAPLEEEEFDDFKSADFSSLSILEVKDKPNEDVVAPIFVGTKLPLEADKGPVEDLFPKCVIRSKEDEESNSNLLADAPVPIDRYSALRLLEVDVEPSKTSDQEEFGDFLTAETPAPVQTPILTNVLTETNSNIQERCMLACIDLLEEAVKIFDSIEDDDVKNEVITDPKGIHYIEELIEVERIALRIKVSFQKKDFLERLEAALEALICYMEPHRHSYVEEEKGPKCGICLSERGPAYVKYGINNFHAPCANLYLHKVDHILPIAPTV